MIDRETAELHKNGVQLRHIGRLDGIAGGAAEEILQAIELTRNNDRLILNVAFNYGGRDEIVHAVQRIVAEGMPAGDVTEELFSRSPVHRRPARPRPDHPHRRRDAPQQLPDLAGGLRRVLHHADILARLRQGASCTRRCWPTASGSGGSAWWPPATAR